MVFRNLLTVHVLADLAPMGGKTGPTGVLGHFGLGRLLALKRQPGRGPKTVKRNFLVLGALWGWGGIGRPKGFSLKVQTFLNFMF